MIDPTIVQRCVIAFNRSKHRGGDLLRTLKRKGSLLKWKVQ